MSNNLSVEEQVWNMKIAFQQLDQTTNYGHLIKLIPGAYQSKWFDFPKTSIGGASPILPSYYLCGWRGRGCLHRLCHTQLIDYDFGHCPEIEPQCHATFFFSKNAYFLCNEYDIVKTKGDISLFLNAYFLISLRSRTISPLSTIAK